ncbi:MAG: anti-sigma factor antagonist [Anaerolineae bacterium]|nr:anti-sigma factor antagonist [Anaerolineae bacterium]
MTAPPFDPTLRDDPEIHGDIMKLKAGGWGIYFVKKLMDTIQYAYRDGLNVLTLTKCMPEDTLTADDLQAELILRPAPLPPSPYWSLEVHGRLDGSNAGVMQSALASQLQQGHAHLILDLGGVDYVASSGLKVLAAAWRSARDQQGNLVLVGLNPRLHEILDIVGFTTFIDIYPNVETALANA